MIRKLETAGGQLAFGVALACATFGAFALAGRVGMGLICGGIVLAYVLVVAIGRRRGGTLEAISGIGDERSEGIATQALAYAGSLLACVIVVWWLVTIARGDENSTLGTLGAVFGGSYIAFSTILQRSS